MEIAKVPFGETEKREVWSIVENNKYRIFLLFLVFYVYTYRHVQAWRNWIFFYILEHSCRNNVFKKIVSLNTTQQILPLQIDLENTLRVIIPIVEILFGNVTGEMDKSLYRQADLEMKIVKNVVIYCSTDHFHSSFHMFYFLLFQVTL